MALKVGDVYVAVTAAIGEFSKSMAKVAKITEDTAKAVKKAAEGVANVGLLFAAGIAGAVALSAQSSADMKAQVDRIKELLFTLGADIGDLFAPVVKHLVELLERVVASFQALSPELKEQMADYAVLAAQVGLAALAIAKVSGAVAGLAEGLGAMAKLVGVAGAPVLVTVAAVAGLIAIVALLWRAWKQNWGNLQEKTKAVLSWIAEKFNALGTVFGAVVQVLVARWATTMRFLMEKAKKFFEFIGADKLAGLMDVGTDVVNWSEFLFTPEGLKELFQDAKKTGAAIGEGIAFGVKETSSAVVDMVQDILKALGIDKTIDEIKRAMETTAAPKIRVNLEDALKEAKAITKGFADSMGAIAKRFTSSLGNVTSVFEGAADGMNAAEFGKKLLTAEKNGTAKLDGLTRTLAGAAAALGPVGMAIAGVLATLASMSEGFQTLAGMVNAVVQSLAEMFTPMFDALQPVVGAVGVVAQTLSAAFAPAFAALGEALQPLAPVIVLVGTVLAAFAPALEFVGRILGAVLQPALRGLFEVIKVVSAVIGGIILGLGHAWNGILDAIKAVLGAISGALEFLGIGSFKGLIRSLDQIKAPVDEFAESLAGLQQLTWEQADAKAAETAATLRQTKAINDATESLTNVPTWWKVAAARFGAADPMSGALAPAAAAPALPGTTLATSPASPAVSVGQINITTWDMDEAGTAMNEYLEKLGKRVGGSPSRGTGFAVP